MFDSKFPAASGFSLKLVREDEAQMHNGVFKEEPALIAMASGWENQATRILSPMYAGNSPLKRSKPMILMANNLFSCIQTFKLIIKSAFPRKVSISASLMEFKITSDAYAISRRLNCSPDWRFTVIFSSDS